jgi:hypothetical protein
MVAPTQFCVQSAKQWMLLPEGFLDDNVIPDRRHFAFWAKIWIPERKNVFDVTNY